MAGKDPTRGSTYSQMTCFLWFSLLLSVMENKTARTEGTKVRNFVVRQAHKLGAYNDDDLNFLALFQPIVPVDPTSSAASPGPRGACLWSGSVMATWTVTTSQMKLLVVSGKQSMLRHHTNLAIFSFQSLLVPVKNSPVPTASALKNDGFAIKKYSSIH